MVLVEVPIFFLFIEVIRIASLFIGYWIVVIVL